MKKRIIAITLLIFLGISLTHFLKSYLLIPGDVVYYDTKDSSKLVIVIGVLIMGSFLRKRHIKMWVLSGCVFVGLYGLSFMHYDYVTEETVVQNKWIGKESSMEIKEIEEMEVGKVTTFTIGDKEIKMELPKKEIKKLEKKVNKKSG